MIKVDKDLQNIPASLNGELTNERRKEIIKAGEYPTKKKLKTNTAFKESSENPYNNRYKYDDIKTQLEKIYNNKCAYCEQKVERYDVEHYRPKSIYYWLAYSWDNLLYCCPDCDTHKSTNFEVEKKVTINQFSIKDIHNLGKVYDEYEKPSFINPEKEAIYEYLIFSKDGAVTSNDKRVFYTIDKTKLFRNKLNERRLELYNDFKDKVTRRCREIRNGDTNAVPKLDALIEDFKIDSKDPIKTFIAFRRYIVENWIADLLKEKLTTNS